MCSVLTAVTGSAASWEVPQSEGQVFSSQKMVSAREEVTCRLRACLLLSRGCIHPGVHPKHIQLSLKSVWSPVPEELVDAQTLRRALETAT